MTIIDSSVVLLPQNDILKKAAFTLAEVLITLGIIGVVAAMTIPNLMTKIENIHFRAAYKKAYSDLSQATKLAIEYGEFPERTQKYDRAATEQEWQLLKNYFKVLKDCSSNYRECWVDADVILWVTGGKMPHHSKAFIDLSGRAWAIGYWEENIYLVDVNGDRKPNQFGRDRFIFTFVDATGERAVTDAVTGVVPLVRRDIKTVEPTCQHPPCYYATWLQ